MRNAAHVEDWWFLSVLSPAGLFSFSQKPSSWACVGGAGPLRGAVSLLALVSP